MLLVTATLAGGGPCEVRVRVSDGYGNPVTSASVTITGGKTSVEAKPEAPVRLDEGSYMVKVVASGFRAEMVPIQIDQLEQVVAVSLRLGRLEMADPSCAVYGHISGSSAISYVRLQEIFGSRSTDVPLSEGRRFDFRSITCGDYLLVVVGQSGCLGTLAVPARPTTGALGIEAPDTTVGCKPLGLEK